MFTIVHHLLTNNTVMKFRKILSAAAAVTLCFSACSSDNTDNGGSPDPTVDQGAEARFTLSINQPATRATDDNALPAENDFYTADVFIYADNTLVKHVRLKSDEFTRSGDHRWVTSTPIVTTEGVKDVYVGLNLPEQLGKDIAAVRSKSGLSIVGRADTYDLASTSTGFVMFSTDKKTVTLDPDNDVTVSVDVARLVAKVTVEKGENLSLDVAGGTVHDLKFAIRNSNLLFYPFQQKDGTTVIDPNHYDQSYAADDFSQAEAKDYVEVDDYDTPVLTREVKYTAENTTEKLYQCETTYASVSAVFVPAKLTNADGTLYDNTNTKPASQVSFWVVKLDENGDTYYFTDETEAGTFATGKGTVSKEYKDGMCYYNLFLNPGNRYQTLRNNFYQCRINTIMGIGNPDPGDGGNKEIPLTEDANIIVDINILDWVMNLDEYDLF